MDGSISRWLRSRTAIPVAALACSYLEEFDGSERREQTPRHRSGRRSAQSAKVRTGSDNPLGL